MPKKIHQLISSLLFLVIFSSFLFAINPPAKQDSENKCDAVSLVHQDAFSYFNNYMGIKQSKKTLLGTMFYWDYKIDL